MILQKGDKLINNSFKPLYLIVCIVLLVAVIAKFVPPISW